MMYSAEQKNQKELLTDLFASRARAAIVRLFMLDPGRAYYQRQIEAVTGLAIRAVQRELDRLAGMALLYRRQEGNRTYYQPDRDFPLFAELRAMVLKTGSSADRLRAALAVDESVRQAFLNERLGQALAVTAPGRRSKATEVEPYTVQTMSSNEFVKTLKSQPDTLAPFLRDGVDLLGRRDDVIWRHIATAGFNVHKGKGVA